MKAPLLPHALMVLLFSAALSSHAQWLSPALDQDWKEGNVPAPPAFSTQQLLPFGVSVHSELRYGLAPETLTVGADGVVRYVWVAQSRSGAINVVYEGILCKAREMKTYARWTPSQLPLPTPFTSADGEWRTVDKGEWVGLRDQASARAAWTLAREALCDGATPNGTPQRMLRDLRFGKSRN